MVELTDNFNGVGITLNLDHETIPETNLPFNQDELIHSDIHIDADTHHLNNTG